MKIISDRARFDALQAKLVSKIASAVREHIRLVFDGHVPANLTGVTKDIVSSVASILDACDGREDAGLPMLTFATNEAREKLVVPGKGEGSWMHEHVHG